MEILVMVALRGLSRSAETEFGLGVMAQQQRAVWYASRAIVPVVSARGLGLQDDEVASAAALSRLLLR